MSKFDDLTDPEKISALRHVAKASLGAALGTIGILVGRGLVAPEELDALLKPMLAEMEKVGHTGDEDGYKLVEMFASLKAMANNNWKGA